MKNYDQFGNLITNDNQFTLEQQAQIDANTTARDANMSAQDIALMRSRSFNDGYSPTGWAPTGYVATGPVPFAALASADLAAQDTAQAKRDAHAAHHKLHFPKMYPNTIGESAAGAEARAMATIAGPTAGLTSQELTDANAADVRKSGHRHNALGVLVNRLDQPIDLQGRIIGTTTVNAPGHTFNSQGNVVDAQGRLINTRRPLVGGRFPMTTDTQGRTVDAQGRLIDDLGRAVDVNGHFPMTTDTQGRTVDAQGRLIDDLGHAVNAQGLTVDSLGRTVDAQGRVVGTQGNTVDSLGRAVNAQGQLINQSFAGNLGYQFAVQKIETDTIFQANGPGQSDYSVDQNTANRLGVSLADLQAASQDLVTRGLAVNISAGYIRKA